MRSIVTRRLLLGALCLAIVGGVSLGAARGTTLASSPGKHARALTTVTFILNWLPNVEFDGLWMAQKFGWWQKAGLKLAFKPYANGVNPEHVEAVIVAEEVLHPGREDETDDPRRESEEDRAHGTREAGSRFAGSEHHPQPAC